MNWGRILLDGIAMSAVFNFGVAAFWMYEPKAFTTMYPKQIQKISPPIDRRCRRIELTMLAAMYPTLLLYGVCSAWNAGMEGFWNLFWASYIQMFLINLGDFFGLDWFLREKMGARLQLPGTEGNELYSHNNWMKMLAIPEHFIAWPLLICPMVALISAGLGMLVR